MIQVKESLCYLSSDFMKELQTAHALGKGTRLSLGLNPGQRRPVALDNLGGHLKKQFVLPDYHSVMKGFVKPDDEAPDPKEQVSMAE